jgi:hypothetical protein
MLCEQVHYCDGGASFPQSTFQVAFFVPHPAEVSELRDKNLNYLADLPERIHNAQCLDDKKKTSSVAFTHECTCCAFLG